MFYKMNKLLQIVLSFDCKKKELSLFNYFNPLKESSEKKNNYKNNLTGKIMDKFKFNSNFVQNK